MHSLAISYGAGAAPIVIHPEGRVRALGTDGTNEAFEQAKLVRRILRARAARTEYLSPRLFAEPAWDMLLELYVSHLMQRRVSITDLCEASRVPPTTALRWIDGIMAEGLVCRMRDPLDARRVFIDLTSKGQDALQRYFDAVGRRVWPLECREQW